MFISTQLWYFIPVSRKNHAEKIFTELFDCFSKVLNKQFKMAIDIEKLGGNFNFEVCVLQKFPMAFSGFLVLENLVNTLFQSIVSKVVCFCKNKTNFFIRIEICFLVSHVEISCF